MIINKREKHKAKEDYRNKGYSNKLSVQLEGN